ncbi:atrial natriuretic peptide receptor 1, partial [Biomphalaria glabrata]
TSVSFKSMAGFLQDVMSHFGWTHIVFVTFNSRVWLETEAEILAELSDSALVTQTLNIDSSDWQNLTSQLQKVGANQYRYINIPITTGQLDPVLRVSTSKPWFPAPSYQLRNVVEIAFLLETLCTSSLCSSSERFFTG